MAENAVAENQLTEKNPVVTEISKILNMDVAQLDMENKKKGTIGMIDDILKVDKNKRNKKLALYIIQEVRGEFFKSLHSDLRKDKKVALSAVQSLSSNYDILPESFQKDMIFAQEAITSLVREGIGFIEVERFIEKYFKDPKKINNLFNFYNSVLAKKQALKVGDLTKSFILLKVTHPQLYTGLKQSDMFIFSRDKIRLRQGVLEKMLGEIKDQFDFTNTPQFEKNLALKDYVFNFFTLVDFQTNEHINSFVQALADILGIELDKLAVPTEIQIQEEGNEGMENFSEDQQEIEEEVDEFEDAMNFYFPSYEVSQGEAGSYQIGLTYGKKLEISQVESQNMTTVALRNYVEFYNTLVDLGISFLWDKYKNGMRGLANNTFGFDYVNGEGITKIKTLAFLNMVGKNVGIPEREVIEEGYKKSKHVKCFKNLADAKASFKEIKETGKINEEIYSDLGLYSHGAVENYLVIHYKLNSKKHTVEFSNWY